MPQDKELDNLLGISSEDSDADLDSMLGIKRKAIPTLEYDDELDQFLGIERPQASAMSKVLSFIKDKFEKSPELGGAIDWQAKRQVPDVLPVGAPRESTISEVKATPSQQALGEMRADQELAAREMPWYDKSLVSEVAKLPEFLHPAVSFAKSVESTQELPPATSLTGKIATGAAQSVGDILTGLSTPRNIGLAALTTVMPEVTIPAIIASMTPEMSYGAYEQGKGALESIKEGDEQAAVRQGGGALLNALMVMGGLKGARSLGGMSAEYGVKARMGEGWTPEMEGLTSTLKEQVKPVPEDFKAQKEFVQPSKWDVSEMERAAPADMARYEGRTVPATGKIPPVRKIVEGVSPEVPPEAYFRGEPVSLSEAFGEVVKPESKFEFEPGTSKLAKEYVKTIKEAPIPKKSSLETVSEVIKPEYPEPYTFGTGEVQKTALGVRSASKAAKENLDISNLPEYEVSSQKQAMDFVARELEENPDRVKRIVMGQERPTDGVPPNTYYVALDHYATQVGDAQLAMDLPNSPLARAATAKGQDISMLQQVDKYGAASSIAEVERARAKNIGKNVLEGTKTELRNTLKDVKLNKLEMWGILDKIRCK